MSRNWKIALTAMGLVTLVLLAAAAALFFSGAVRPAAVDMRQVRIYIQAPPLVDIGEDVEIILTVENGSEQFLSVDEIRLPAELTDAAVVKEVFPSLEPGRQEFYGDQTGFKIGLMLEPGERREFVIRVMPWQIADVASQVQVVSGASVTPVGFRILFNKPKVFAPTPTDIPTLAPTATLIPLTATLEPTLTATHVALPYKAVVKIIAKIKHSSYLRDLWGGSGTILTADGFILTNAHLVLPLPGAKPSAFVIAMTLDPAEPPVEMYFADTVVVDEDIDLAILRITTDLKFNEIDWDVVQLPTVQLGDSDLLQLGDPITILGYPGIGGQTITLTSGNVGGFTAQRNFGERAFIKTAATISGGTSGGMVLNAKGEMVAVPTQLGSGTTDDLVDCRVITDTNGDGNINQFDACVPVGGFINALRPINLARQMLDSLQQPAVPLTTTLTVQP